ncbi:hypothetical protein EES42_41660 [Streptomyces sp. ADI95-17]|nr:hypothetical protein EES42_41660 [Streptomyces sp. ADI95-17]
MAPPAARLLPQRRKAVAPDAPAKPGQQKRVGVESVDSTPTPVQRSGQLARIPQRWNVTRWQPA